MNFQSLLQKYRYFNSKNNMNTNTNTKVNTFSKTDPIKYIMPLIRQDVGGKEKEEKNRLSLTKILHIDTNLDYDYEKQVAEEKIAEEMSYSNNNPNINSNYNHNPKYKYITFFFVFGIIVFPIYKYLYIYK